MAKKVQAKVKQLLARFQGLFPHALPIGVKEFDEFCSLIFSTYEIPDLPSYREAIATMILHQPPTSHTKSLNWFRRCVRKAQANEVAFNQLQEFKRLDAEKRANEKSVESSVQSPAA